MPENSTKSIVEKGKATRFKAGAEQAEIARKGGIASQAVQRQRRTIANLALEIMNNKVSDKNKSKLKALGIDEDEATNRALISASMVTNAIKGDQKAIDKLLELDSKAEKEFKAYELPARVIGKAFSDINRQIEPNKTYVFEGGRGGLKSSYISLKIIEILKNNPNMHAVIVRKIGGTLKDSVFNQMQWAITELGLEEEFKFARGNPPEITLLATGQKIYFRGVDDPVKLKGIKPPFGYCGILWKEEKDQLAGEAEERSVNQSTLRGAGTAFYDFSSYNPPKSKDAWVHRALLVPDPKRVVHHSTYLEAPPEWLGQKFIEDAEHLKVVNPEAYEHEYLGVANGEGGAVFHNIETVELTDEEVSTYDMIFQGIDWGDAPDPSVFVRLYYDADSETVTFIDEMYEKHMSNTEIAEWIQERGYDDFMVTCDSSEPRSVTDLKDLGISAKKATKGAGSVAYGMKWLEIRKIRIDPNRTPNVYNEFINYEFERDKEGNVISGYPDKNNHTIDATRYALERYCNKRYSQA